MRILIAHSSYRTFGGEDRYVDQQEALLTGPHEVMVLRRSNEELRPSISTAARMLYSPAQVSKVRDDIERFRPDVIHLHNAYPALGPAVHLAAHRLKIPLVMTVHNYRLRCPNGYKYTEGSICHRCESGVYIHALLHACFPSRTQSASYAAALWTHRFILQLERKVQLFVAPSTYVLHELHRWGIPAKHTMLIRNFTDQAAGGVGQPGRYGLFVGRLSSEKGIDVLLRALQIAGDPEFKIVGDGPVARQLAELAADLGLHNTAFVGRVDSTKVSRLLKNARYMVIPSLWNENAPLAALEAMANGRPLLVTEVGGLPELVAGGGGLSSTPGDPSALANGILRFVNDPGLYRRAGRAALTMAREEFTAEVHRLRLEQAYSRALSSGESNLG